MLSSIFIPSTFWKFNWHTRLSVGAIHLYLAGEAEKLSSPFAPWWRMKRDDIAAKYGFQKQLVGRAQEELKSYCLLETLHEMADAPDGRFIRYMNYFRQNPFYDYDARVVEIDAVTTKYTPKVVTAARKLASIVKEDSDAEKIAALCRLIKATGPASASKAARKIGALAANSTKRTFGYVEELLSGGWRNAAN